MYKNCINEIIEMFEDNLINRITVVYVDKDNNSGHFTIDRYTRFLGFLKYWNYKTINISTLDNNIIMVVRENA